MFRRLGFVFAFCSIFAAVAANAAEGSHSCMAKCGEVVGDYQKCLYVCGFKYTEEAE